MKSLIKKIANSNFGINIRNNSGVSSIPIMLSKKFKKISVSDAFLWRTDKGFKTTFKYADILGLFYKIDCSYVEFFFYSKENKLIKKIIVNELNYSNELLIDKDFLNGLEDYGVFYIFHRYDSYLNNDLAISNRCYVGFSIDNGLSSFVHGNCYVKYQSLDGKNEGSDMVKTALFENTYRIQNSFDGFTKSELFFVNPTSKVVKFSIGKNLFNLDKNCSILIDVTKMIDISIKSKCMFFRPLIFNYKGNFFDVYHS